MLPHKVNVVNIILAKHQRVSNVLMSACCIFIQMHCCAVSSLQPAARASTAVDNCSKTLSAKED